MVNTIKWDILILECNMGMPAKVSSSEFRGDLATIKSCQVEDMVLPTVTTGDTTEMIPIILICGTTIITTITRVEEDIVTITGIIIRVDIITSEIITREGIMEVVHPMEIIIRDSMVISSNVVDTAEIMIIMACRAVPLIKVEGTRTIMKVIRVSTRVLIVFSKVFISNLLDYKAPLRMSLELVVAVVVAGLLPGPLGRTGVVIGSRRVEGLKNMLRYRGYLMLLSLDTSSLGHGK